MDILPHLHAARNIIKPKIDPWKDTALQGYLLTDSDQQGAFGEIVISSAMESRFNCIITPAPTRTSGFDRYVDGEPTEMKFSVANYNKRTNKFSPNRFNMVHLSILKNWKKLIFMGVNPDFSVKSFFMTKDSFIQAIEINKYKLKDEKFFSVSSSGGDINNSDLRCSYGQLTRLSRSPYTFPMERWNDTEFEVEDRGIFRNLKEKY